MCYIFFWTWSNSNSAWATINKINRPAAALRCSSLCGIATVTPCQDLASKYGIDSENKPTLQHESPTRVEKMQDWEAWVRGQRIAMTIWYDPERSIRIWCLHEDDGLSFPYRLQKFPLFLSSSYRLQKFADTDRLRVNRRPIRKDFFPGRYDFVPIVFTSSSCKRGLSVTVWKATILGTALPKAHMRWQQCLALLSNRWSPWGVFLSCDARNDAFKLKTKKKH